MTTTIKSAGAKQAAAAMTDRTELSLETRARVAGGFTYKLTDVKISSYNMSSEPLPAK